MRRVTLVSPGLRAGKSPAFLVLQGLARLGRSQTKKPGMSFQVHRICYVTTERVHSKCRDA
jgi:hypothetical protein